MEPHRLYGPKYQPLYVPIMLKLPDGRLVFERRTDDAPYEGGKLGMFGGGAEPGETAEQCLIRELFREETSLNPRSVPYWHLKDYYIPRSKKFPMVRYFSLFEGIAPNLDFEVHEGRDVEAYHLDELPYRTDLMETSIFLLRTILRFY